MTRVNDKRNNSHDNEEPASWVGEDFLNFMCKRIEEVLINMGCEIPTTTDMKILMHVYMGIGKMFRLLESLVTKQFCYFPWP